jgi:hypothetical protein
MIDDYTTNLLGALCIVDEYATPHSSCFTEKHCLINRISTEPSLFYF